MARAEGPSGVSTTSWRSSWPDGPPASGIVPSLWADRRGVGFAVGGSVAFDFLSADARLRPDETGFRGWAIELAGQGAGRPLDRERPSASMSARLHAVHGGEGHDGRDGSGAWLAASAVRIDLDGREALPLLGTGGWIRRGRFTLATQWVQLLTPVRTSTRITTIPTGADSLEPTTRTPPGTIARGDLRLFTGAEASLGWTLRRLELESRAGVVVGAHRRPARWGELRASYRPVHGLSLFASTRSAMDVPEELEAIRGPNTALGLELAPRSGEPGAIVFAAGPRPSRPEPLGDGRYRIVLRVSGRSIELTCDATNWTPVPATRVSPWVCEVVLPFEPGVHRIAMRTDGGPWRAPPGFPSTIDEFGGEVGLLVVD